MFLVCVRSSWLFIVFYWSVTFIYDVCQFSVIILFALPSPKCSDIVNEPLQGLADALSQIRERGGGETDTANREEHYLQLYLNDELQSVSCLKYWQKQDKNFGNHKVKGALCRLARFDFFSGFIYSHFTLL
jgi:hypothetical protein